MIEKVISVIYIKYILNERKVLKMSIKIRKVGTSNVLTVPKNIKTTSSEYEVYKGRNGVITYIPVTPNPFHTSKTIEKYGVYDGDDTGFVDAGIEDEEL